MVFIFAKTPDDALAGLVKQIDQVVAKHADKRVAAVVNFVGEPTDEYLSQTKEFGEKHGVKHVALTTTRDGDRFNINEDAEVTVMNYVGKVVKFNYAVGKGELNEAAVKAIVEGTSSIVK